MAITGNFSHTNLLMFMGVTEAKRRTRGRPSEDLIVRTRLRISEGRNFKPNLKDILGSCTDTECLNFAK